MNRPWKALTTVYLRRAAMFGVPGLAAAIILPWLFAGMVGLPSDWTVSEANPLGLYLYAVGSVCCLSGLAAWAPLPDYIKGVGLQNLPLSNRSLGSFLWLVPGSVVAVSTLVFMFGCEVVYVTNWPIQTTVVSITAFCTLCMSLGFWMRKFHILRLLLALVIISACIVWFVGRFYPSGFRQPLVPWTEFSVVDMVLVAVALVGSWLLQVTAWSEMRCGESRLPVLFTWGEQELYAISDRGSKAGNDEVISPKAGLLAMEWRRCRPIAIVGGFIVAAFGIYLCSMILIKSPPNSRIIGMIPMMCGFGGFIVGIMAPLEWAWNSRNPGVRPFIGALPFSDRALSRSILVTLARGLIVIVPVSLCGLLIPVVTYWIFVGPVNFRGASIPPDSITPLYVSTVVVATVAAVWSTGGISATVTVTGSKLAFVAAYVIGIGIPLAILCLDKFAGPTGELIATALQWGTGVAVLVATIVCFVKARQRELIADSTVVICCAAGAALAFAIGTTLANEWLLRFQGVCFAALVVVSFASLPLAVSWNRHR